jgi:hypothetical protein
VGVGRKAPPPGAVTRSNVWASLSLSGWWLVALTRSATIDPPRYEVRGEVIGGSGGGVGSEGLYRHHFSTQSFPIQTLDQ